MFCEKCGTKNNKGAKFCESCGNKLVSNVKEKINVSKVKKQSSNLFNKLKNCSKKIKIIGLAILLLIVVSIILLVSYFSNPIRLVDKNLDNYYETQEAEYLVEIGEVLKKNKEKENKLNDIKDVAHEKISNWVEAFNQEYENQNTLENWYYDVTLNVIEEIYDYFNGLEYMIDEDYYDFLTDEIKDLYNSKTAYLNAHDYEENDNLLKAYNNYIKVIEKDCYYTKAQTFVNNYIKEHIKKFEDEVKKVVTDLNPNTDEEIKNAYVKQLEYLNDNKTYNGLDVSNTENYKNLYNNAKKTVIDKVIAGVKTLNNLGNSSTNLEKYNVYMNQEKYLSDNYKLADIELIKEEDYKKINDEVNKNVYDISLIIASDYKKAYDYDNAIKTLSDAKYYVKDNNTYADELDKLIKEYEASRPVAIASLKYTDNSSWISKTTSKGDINDIKYNSYLRYGFDGENEHMTFDIEKKYTRFRAQIVRGLNWEKNQKGTIVIYGDDKELYRSTTITPTNEFDGNIDIDITNVSKLKVELQTTYNSRTGIVKTIEYIYVINGLLYY